MLHVLLDNVEIEVPEGLTILQVCTLSNFDLPRFCYHERLSIAGNCRMCLVETNISKKLVIACATPVVDKMIILIDSLRVRKSREGVLEFLLSNHPLDCPICDQGGECDLQDLTFLYGSDRGRFYELSKRSVGFKYFGLFVKTFMTRCIHCTRCVRFLVEVCGFFELGLVSRGVLMEISTYVNGWIEHELGGNIIDLCPVGALTSKYFSFVGRSWECFSIESLDLLDGFCSPIRFDIIGNKVVRVLPAINVLLNEEWITNKIRFFYDSLYLQRIVFPLVNFSYFFSVLRVYCSVSWEFVFRLLGFFFFKNG
jgi:NADH dehydrogenase/NADH:ubiquinone oxidoreductase subunit G